MDTASLALLHQSLSQQAFELKKWDANYRRSFRVGQLALNKRN